MAINGVAFSGFFSSDRTITEYCEDIWDITPCSIPMPSTNIDGSEKKRSYGNLNDV